MRHPAIFYYAAVALIALFSGCGDKSTALPPAPPGERVVLEKLAEAYEQISDQGSSSPNTWTPEDKHKFVREVFRKAGYDYSATLIRMGDAFRPADPLHRDLVELLFLPHTHIAPEKLSDLYSDEEIAAIERITAALAR
jgi:hypothetical protein